MNIKDEMEEFRKNYKQPITLGEKIVQSFKRKSIESDSLDDKVDNFINWYTENMVRGNCTEIGLYSKPKEVRNLIEKMAVWYELRYPDQEIDKIFQPNKENQVDINEEIFINNPITKDLISEPGDWGKWSKLVLERLDWSKFYNIDVFISSLSEIERKYLEDFTYNSYVTFHATKYDDIKIYLNEDGDIIDINQPCIFPLNGEEYILREDLIGMKIEDAAVLLENRYKCNDGKLEDIKSEINQAKKYKIFKKGLLECVLYRLIERDQSSHGAKRAFIFAQEFNQNIDIPMQYGYCSKNFGLKEFIELYLKVGGNEELVSYSNYQTRIDKKEQLKGYKVKELLKTSEDNA